MARKYAQIAVTIWDDDDFLDLSPMAQWLYIHLATHPDLSFCGAMEWRPKRIKPKATGLNLELIESAAQELTEGLFIILDEDTEEVLVRSFMRNDGLLKTPNMGSAVGKAYSSVASRYLKGVVVHELKRIQAEQPKWDSFTKLTDVLAKRSINPSEEPA